MRSNGNWLSNRGNGVLPDLDQLVSGDAAKTFAIAPPTYTNEKGECKPWRFGAKVTDAWKAEQEAAGREIIAQKPMDAFRVGELSPGTDCQRDEDWLEFARANGQTIYHAAGTCRMGDDAMAVVDPELRVRGIAGLRVIDASVMPEMVSGNTQAAVMMIAAKGAEILASAR